MAYFTGTATSLTDLLTKVVGHVNGVNGWTASYASSIGTFTKNDVGFHVERADVTTGYDAFHLSGWTTAGGPNNLDAVSEVTLAGQVGKPRCYPLPEANAIPGYHVFVSPDYQVIVVFQIYPGVWRRFQFGVISKVGTWKGGAYIGCTYSNGEQYLGGIYVGRDNQQYEVLVSNGASNSFAITTQKEDGSVGWASSQSATYNTSYSYPVPIGPYYPYSYSAYPGWHPNVSLSPHPQTGERIMLAWEIGIVRPSNYISPAGYVPNVRFVSTKGLNDAEVITINSEDWMVFPNAATGDPADTSLQYNTGYNGIAIKKIP